MGSDESLLARNSFFHASLRPLIDARKPGLNERELLLYLELSKSI